jgi:site-specific recombinase XerD
MEPLAELRWLKTVSNKLHRSAIPMHRPAHRVSSEVFFRRAVRELAELDRLELARKANATQFRNALILALQAACPLRRKNLAGLTVGGSLVKLGNQFEIAIDGSEMKNGRDHRVIVPKTLARYLQIYLDIVRPVLLRGQDSAALWINWYGKPMTDHAVYLRFAKYTKQLFGFAVTIHDLRHCAASTLAVVSVRSAYSAQGLLGHSNVRTTEKHYVKARQLEASRHMNSLLMQMR